MVRVRIRVWVSVFEATEATKYYRVAGWGSGGLGETLLRAHVCETTE